jgi:hypothetical protein
MSRNMKLLSAAVGAAVLIATPALARALPKQALASNQIHSSGGKVIGISQDQNIPVRRHGILMCGLSSANACDSLEILMQSGP